MTRGATYLGKGRVEACPVEPAEPGDGEVRVRVAYCGLCGTDLHIYQGHMDERVAAPLVFGHEMSGTIDAVGPAVAGWQVGDKVTVMPLRWDGTCAACHDGHQHICSNLSFIGIDAPGALQELWTVPADTLVRLPASLDLRTAAWSSRLRSRYTTYAAATCKPGTRWLCSALDPSGRSSPASPVTPVPRCW